jgi:hypothetical protein
MGGNTAHAAMTRRRTDMPNADFIKSFTHALKRDVKAGMQGWQNLNREQAVGRRAAYPHIVALLQRTAGIHGIALADIGLVDDEVAEFQDLP